jgi:hypothetical protein
MAAIVTTMLCVPAGALLAAVLFFFGISLPALVTLGGTLHPVLGLTAWWIFFLVPALVYSAWVLPWIPAES